jgi:glutamine amidotransferase-like uncharacterized protein
MKNLENQAQSIFRAGYIKSINIYNTMHVTRIILITSVAIFLCINPFLKTAHSLNGGDVALYNDSIAPSEQSGVWQDGITAIKNMLTTKGFTYEEITYKDLNESTQNFSNLYKVILIPGGYAPWYNYWISLAGKTRIRNFMKGGGGYFGICAGAYFACGRIVYDGVSYDNNYGYINAYNEPTGYDLDLFSGTGTGSIYEIAKYPAYKMTTINFQTENSVLKGYKQIPYTEEMLYYGGPYFTSDTGSQAEILGTYNINGQPAIVAFNYGSGKVVLSGPHPETGGPNWDLASYMLNWLMKPNLPSCPSLYFWDGDEYVRKGSIFPGAFFQEKEYRDHILLGQLVPMNGEYHLQIRETEPERSLIDMAYLIVIDRSIDNNGNAFTKGEPISESQNCEFSGEALDENLIESRGSIIRQVVLYPSSATHFVLGDVRRGLLYPDNRYVQMDTGDIITLTFPYFPEVGTTRDFIFVVEGFYIPPEK